MAITPPAVAGQPGRRTADEDTPSKGAEEAAPLSPVNRPDLPEPPIAQEGPSPIDPSGGAVRIASASGAGTKGVEAGDDAGEPLIGSIHAALPTAVDMLGQPGSSDLDFGGGAGGGGGRLPDDGAVDPGEGQDVARQTDGAEQDPFDQQHGTLEQADDETESDGAGLPPIGLRPVDEAEHLREVTLDIG